MLSKTIANPPVRVRHAGVSVELVPLAVAFVAISFAFGVVGREAGLGAGWTVLMSALVYGGTSQVVALGLLAAHQPAWLIVLITLLINGRFFLLSTVMVRLTKSWPQWMRALFALQLTDETFALFLNPASPGLADPGRALRVQCGAYIAWVGGTALGYAIGADTTQLRGLGLDFALLAMMLAVLVMQVRDVKCVAVVVVAAAVGMAFHAGGLAWAAPLVAALVAPAAGVYLERRWKTAKS